MQVNSFSFSPKESAEVPTEVIFVQIKQIVHKICFLWVYFYSKYFCLLNGELSSLWKKKTLPKATGTFLI